METTLHIDGVTINFEGVILVEIITHGIVKRLGITYTNQPDDHIEWITQVAHKATTSPGTSTVFVNLYFTDNERPNMVFSDKMAIAIQDWIESYHQRNEGGFAEIMGTVPAPELSQEIIDTLRKIASNSERPSELLHYLRQRISNVEVFLRYLCEAFGDDGLFQVIGYRWWMGSYSSGNVDEVLTYALQSTQHLWKNGTK